MARKTSDDWIAAAFDALVEGGVGGVRVEALARRLGVTKGSFYWHFADRPALLRAMLAWWEDVATERVIRQVDAGAPTPVERLELLTEVSFRDPRSYNDVEAAIRGWALTGGDAAAVVARVDRRRLDYVTALLVEAGVAADVADERAAIYYRVLVGEFTWCGYGGDPLAPSALAQLLGLMVAEDTAVTDAPP